MGIRRGSRVGFCGSPKHDLRSQRSPLRDRFSSGKSGQRSAFDNNYMRDVQEGNLNIQLPVSSTDEVGRLTDSFNFFVQELRSKERMKRTFGKYIDPRILEHVLAQPGAETATGGRRDMTVSFADLVGFTSLSERLTPLLMVTLLNRHFGLQALAVQEYRGIVDKFVGDSVVAFWGPPFVKVEEHAMLAWRVVIRLFLETARHRADAHDARARRLHNAVELSLDRQLFGSSATLSTIFPRV